MARIAKTRVLFICMGNICRSPTAEGVFTTLVNNKKFNHLIESDSAGTHAYHIGNPPDERAQTIAKNYGVDLSLLIARKVKPEDFNDFDYIIAMDKENLINLKDIQDKIDFEVKASLHLFMEFSSNTSFDEVPDPYYGGEKGFDEVFKMVADASEGLIKKIVNT